MAAARHYWNTALPLIKVALERELLMNPLTILLECISQTSDKVTPGKVCIANILKGQSRENQCGLQMLIFLRR